MKSISLTDSKSRIEFRCTVNNYQVFVWLDTGAPNTLISKAVVERLKLKPNTGKRFNGIVAGSSFRNVPSVTIPLISVQDKLNLRNIRAIVGLPDTDAWKHTIVLGMNVLNH